MKVNFKENTITHVFKDLIRPIVIGVMIIISLVQINKIVDNMSSSRKDNSVVNKDKVVDVIIRTNDSGSLNGFPYK